MLKMECPNCKHQIYSHLLAEVDSVVCKNCKTDVPVGDVYVTAKGYTMLRKDLVMRMHRYEKLLNEAENEVSLMMEGEKTCDETVQSIDRFIGTLKEMLEAARNNFRMYQQQLPVNLKVNDKTISGIMINMSTTGACVEPEDGSKLPKLHEKIELIFSLDGIEEAFEIKGKVCWIKKKTSKSEFNTGIGIQFKELDKKTNAKLWAHIEKLDTVFTRAAQLKPPTDKEKNP